MTSLYSGANERVAILLVTTLLLVIDTYCRRGVSLEITYLKKLICYVPWSTAEMGNFISPIIIIVVEVNSILN